MLDFPGGPVVKTPKIPMQGAQVQSLIEELKSYRLLWGAAKNI